MALTVFGQFDRDFPGGIYLPPLGSAPPVDRVETVDYEGDLFLPLGTTVDNTLRLDVKPGQRVHAGDRIAYDHDGHVLYAPRNGKIGDITDVWLPNNPAQPAVTLLPPDDETPVVWNHLDDQERHCKTPPSWSDDDAYHPEAVWQAIDQAGILIPSTGQPLSRLLQQLDKKKLQAVVANAVPLESGLNTPLLLLNRFSDQVFAGLSIIKRWIEAAEAVLAYPHHIRINKSAADIWQVRCVTVSEKYPQARSPAVLKTLKIQGDLTKTQVKKTAVFDCQMLREVERAVLAGMNVTTRIITISGDGVKHPSHFIAPIGLPLMELLNRAVLFPDTQCIVHGSSLAGAAVDPDLSVIGPTDHNFIALRSLPDHLPQACIRCGWCIDDCPARIDPARLFDLGKTGQVRTAHLYGVEKCVECGICTYICPSHLRIVEHIRMLKNQLKQLKGK